MDFDEIENLVDLVARSSVTEVTLRTPERRLTVRKAPAAVPVAAAAPTGGALAVPAPVPASPQGPPIAEEEVPELRYITAPIVGIFHHAEPPIGPGTEITAGQVVGVIESMKLMNEIRAEFGGVVREVLIEAGMAVEYGQPLFGLED